MSSKQHTSVPALCYCRVSRGRDEEANSLTTQANKCKKFAEENKLNIIDVYKETISGYTDIIHRTKLTDLLNRCARDNISHIIINDLHRLTRSFRDGLLLLDWLHRRGISLHVVKLQKTIREIDYLDIVQEFVDGERLYQKYVSTPNTHQNKSQMGKPPWGYTKSNSKLKKNKLYQDEITEIFKLATDKKRNRQWNINEIADFIANSSITDKKSRSINNLIRNPIYTGKLISLEEYQQNGLEKYPKVHDHYISDKNFDLINDKRKRKLKYTDLLFCYSCKQQSGEDKKLYLDENYFRCSDCDKKISHTNFHDEMMKLCASFSFDEPFSKSDMDSEYDIYLQLESLLTTIITQWESTNNGYISSSRVMDEQERKELSSLVKKALQLTEEVSAYVDLHYKMRKELDDDGAAIKNLIEKCFDHIYVAVGKNNTIENSQKRIEPFTKKNLITNNTHRDLKSIVPQIRDCVFHTHKLLQKNPFITDFLAYRIIDDRFNQWGKLIDYLE